MRIPPHTGDPSFHAPQSQVKFAIPFESGHAFAQQIRRQPGYRSVLTRNSRSLLVRFSNFGRHMGLFFLGGLMGCRASRQTTSHAREGRRRYPVQVIDCRDWEQKFSYEVDLFASSCPPGKYLCLAFQLLNIRRYRSLVSPGPLSCQACPSVPGERCAGRGAKTRYLMNYQRGMAILILVLLRWS